MSPRWVVVIVAWLVAGATVITCAVAWGPDGRGLTFALAALVFVVVTLMTAGLSGDESRDRGRTHG